MEAARVTLALTLQGRAGRRSREMDTALVSLQKEGPAVQNTRRAAAIVVGACETVLNNNILPHPFSICASLSANDV